MSKGYQPFTDLLNAEIERLQEMGATINEVAAGCGVSRQQLDEWRKGHSAPGVENYLRCAEFFGWPHSPELRVPEPEWRSQLRAVNDGENSWTRQTPSDLVLRPLVAAMA